LIVKILRKWPRKPTLQSNIFRKIQTLVDVLDLGSGLAQQLLKWNGILPLPDERKMLSGASDL
jgi:hypothetical protein